MTIHLWVSFLFFVRLEGLHIPPDFASIVLRACNNSISFIVELAWEDLIFVSFEYLQHFSTLNIPKSCRMIKTGWENLSALRVEYSFGNLSFVPFQDRSALEVSYIVHSHCHINACRHQTRTDGVKVEVQDLVGVPLKDGHALAWTYVPKPAGFVDGCGTTHVSSELKLCCWDLACVTL